MMEKESGFVAELKMAWKKRITARTAKELTAAETPIVADASSVIIPKRVTRLYLSDIFPTIRPAPA